MGISQVRNSKRLKIIEDHDLRIGRDGEGLWAVIDPATGNTYLDQRLNTAIDKAMSYISPEIPPKLI